MREQKNKGLNMIGRLSGKILAKQPPSLVLDVAGVGYEISAPMSTFGALPKIGEVTTLFIHTLVREDDIALYGFKCDEDRKLFRALIKVNGVGAKLAITILSSMSAQEFIQNIQQQNITYLTRIPGIGKKTAERLLVETKDRLAKWLSEDATIMGVTPHASAGQEAIDALISLGYKNKEAENAIHKIYDASHDVEQLVRAALKNMVKG